MVESEIKVCKRCHETKTRYMLGKFPDGRNKKWRSETGKLWNGNLCPDCHKAVCRERNKRLRDEQNS